MVLTVELTAQCKLTLRDIAENYAPFNDITLTLAPKEGVVENYKEPAIDEWSDPSEYEEQLYLVKPIKVLVTLTAE